MHTSNVFSRAVVLESGLGLESGVETVFYRLGLVGIWTRTWSLDSPNVLVGLDQIQQYMLFFSFKTKPLIWQTGNVIAIGLTPSRTGIVIGRRLNAQLHHMSVRAAWRHTLFLFWPQTRCRQVA